MVETTLHIVDPKNPGAVDEIINPLWILSITINPIEVISIIAYIQWNIKLSVFMYLPRTS